MDYPNVLLRSLTLRDPQRPVARQAVKTLLSKGAALCVASQNLVELWSVCTRPAIHNRLGKTIAATDGYLRYIESFAAVLPETPELFTKWREIVVAHQVIGTKVYDARLVAAMTLHNIPRILTFNIRDFARYRNIEAVDPATV